jgi:type I site-specific restriction endonuclease
MKTRRRTTAKRQDALERALAQRDELRARLARYEPEETAVAASTYDRTAAAARAAIAAQKAEPKRSTMASIVADEVEIVPVEYPVVEPAPNETVLALRDELAEERSNGEREHQRAEALEAQVEEMRTSMEQMRAAIRSRENDNVTLASDVDEITARAQAAEAAAARREAAAAEEGGRAQQALLDGAQAVEMVGGGQPGQLGRALADRVPHPDLEGEVPGAVRGRG